MTLPTTIPELARWVEDPANRDALLANRGRAAELALQMTATDTTEAGSRVRRRAAELLRAQGDFDRPRLNLSSAPSQPALAKRRRLTLKDSVSDWQRAQGEQPDELADGVTPTEAWGSWFRGWSGQGWDNYLSSFKAQQSTTPDSAGGFLIPTPLSTRVIDRLRAETPIFQAGAVTVPMTSKTLDIARVATDVTATAWHAEHAAITPTQVGLERVRFTAKSLPVLVKASREVVEDAPNLGEVEEQSISGAIAVELTRQALRGDGAANNPTGVRNQTGVQTTAGVGAADWLDVGAAVAAIRGRNVEPNAYISHPRTQTALEHQTGGDGHFVAPPPSVAALDRYRTTAIPSNLGAGTNETELYVARWASLLIGVRTQLRIEPLRERYADTGEVAWLAWLRQDVQLEHPESFQVLAGITN